MDTKQILVRQLVDNQHTTILQKSWLIKTDSVDPTLQNDFFLNLTQYHPGMPGWDLVYELETSFLGHQLDIGSSQIVCDHPDVDIQHGRIVIPERIHNGTSSFTITATHQEPGGLHYHSSLTMNFRPWTLTLEDAFHELNRQLWAVDDGTQRGTIVMDASGCYVQQDKLCLMPRRKDYKGSRVTGCDLSTRGAFSQLYGCFTSRIKMPERGGILSSFWLMPDGRYRVDNFFVRDDICPAWRCSEIDIVEHWAESGSKIHIGEHFWAPESCEYLGAFSHKYDIPDFEPGEFYEYTCVWLPDGMYYYVDGVLAGVTEKIRPDSSVPAYIQYSAYPSEEPSWYGQMMESDYGVYMEVDWLRVYR